MRTLYIVRHAKSSWDDPDAADFDRPLNQRGERDAPGMGQRLKAINVNPGLICSSPALRAITTAQHIADAIGYPRKSILQDRKLYHADEETILKVIQGFDDSKSSAIIVGHNPGLTEFANELLGKGIDNIPTTGVISSTLNVNSWKEVNWKCGEMVFFDYPKKK